jgi:hypothetical protein
MINCFLVFCITRGWLVDRKGQKKVLSSKQLLMHKACTGNQLRNTFSRDAMSAVISLVLLRS